MNTNKLVIEALIRIEVPPILIANNKANLRPFLSDNFGNINPAHADPRIILVLMIKIKFYIFIFT